MSHLSPPSERSHWLKQPAAGQSRLGAGASRVVTSPEELSQVEPDTVLVTHGLESSCRRYSAW
jgi:hypothetical protein